MSNPKFDYWFGIEREKIDWHPSINYDKCVSCRLCVAVCGRGVYAVIEKKSVVVQPNNCLVGCTTCANMCPASAIEFPPGEKAREYVKIYNVWPKIREIAEEKSKKILATLQPEDK